VLTVVLVPILIGAGVAGWFYVVRVVPLKSSEPYQSALKRVQTDAGVIARLGQPIRDASWVPSGSVNVENGRGNANLIFKVAGPKGMASVRTDARRIQGTWGTTILEVTFADSQRISLDTGPGGELDAPKFEPSGVPPGPSAPKADAKLPSPKPADGPGPELKIEIPTFEPPGKES
jgi:hypothetical protein